MSLLTCEALSLSYDKTAVLKDLSFSLVGGEYLCIVGENGSGKSSLLKALLGLVPISSGKIVYDSTLEKKNIAYLAQQSDLQNDFPASVLEVILSGRLCHKKFFSFYAKEDKTAAAKVMEDLQITPYRDRSFRELSGGQKQRVLLARALVSGADLLFVDEPTTGLDPVVTADFYRMIETVHESGKTVVMVTHDIPAATKYATHILHLYSREGYFFGTRDEYLAAHREGGNANDCL